MPDDSIWLNVSASTVALALEACALGGLGAVEQPDRPIHKTTAIDADDAALRRMSGVIMINGKDTSFGSVLILILTRL